jgi:L-ribulokinase
MSTYTLGVDFGTNSVRAVVADCSNGEFIGSSVFDYPSGDQGILLDGRDHHLARQHPADYLEGLQKSVLGAMKVAGETSGFDVSQVIGIGVDTTGSTPLPVDGDNIPLALGESFRDTPAAMAWLWKDHTGADEAERITEIAAEHRPEYLAKCGNTYSSEWFWSKIWKCLNSAPEVFDAAYSWVELADYIPSVLAGVIDPTKIVRGVCQAGHKGLYCDEWGGLPDLEFLAMLDPKLAELRPRLFEQAFDADTPAGHLCSEWASTFDLPEGIPIAIGALDAHCGAIGSGVCVGTMVKIIGTSTCDCTVASKDHAIADIPGICGIVDGSILPGHYGLEAGQSAVGDIFKWFVETVCLGDDDTHARLTEEAATLQPGQSGLLALDWNNGNRTILVDPLLTGLLVGQTLHTTQAEIYRALIEATAFGARAIIERIKEYDVPIDRIVCCGGIAEKNPLLMQIYADITGCTMEVAGSDQACALGAALMASVAGGAYDSFGDAQAQMTTTKETKYSSEAQHQNTYDRMYALYKDVHDTFGVAGNGADLSHVMKELLVIKNEAGSN